MRLSRDGTGLFGLVRCFELHILLDDLRHIFFDHLHISESCGPNHHIGTESADIETTRSDHANFSFEELFDDLFRTTVTARRAFAIAIANRGMNLSDVDRWIMKSLFGWFSQ